MANKEHGFGEPEKSFRGDVEFKGGERDSLSNEAAQELHEIAEHWNEFADPISQLDRWCEHYYGDRHVPINFALKLWKHKDARDALWPFVEIEFEQYSSKLAEHGATPEMIADIDQRLGSRELE